MALSLTFSETLKLLSSLPILMLESFSPSLTSLMVSVDVKHHVYISSLYSFSDLTLFVRVLRA